MKIPMKKISIADLNKANYQGCVLAPLMDDLSGVTGDVMVDVKKGRNVGNHRRFFAFIALTFDLQDEFDNREIWRKYIQMKAGFFTEVVTGNGKILYWPQSISWDSLDEIEFKDLFNRVVNAFMRYYGQDLNDIQINTILEF